MIPGTTILAFRDSILRLSGKFGLAGHNLLNEASLSHVRDCQDAGITSNWRNRCFRSQSIS